MIKNSLHLVVLKTKGSHHAYFWVADITMKRNKSHLSLLQV